MAKKFPLGRVKELAAHVKGLHEHLQSLIADCEGTAEDDTVGAGTIKNATAKPASDNSDAGETWQGQDSALDRPPSTAKAMNRVLANSKINANR